jgi:carboxyl-terminal processing protease
MTFTGAITGGVNCSRCQVRYVLDGSPASASGIVPGDEIVSVDGKPYVGQLSFAGTAGRTVTLTVRRNSTELHIKIKPKLEDTYSCYVKAIEKSVRITKTPEGVIGYVHLWTGGEGAHEMFENLLGGKLQSTDGLILDLRDGYGANFFTDLDYFYRPPTGYPPTTMTWRSGRRDKTVVFYDKPVVALINGGVRSGKELVAFSLKQTRRAKLVGERTAGAVVAGKLFPIDSRTYLYLAVAAGSVGGVNLEGRGVDPDIVVAAGCTKTDKDGQLAEADRLIRQEVRARTAASAGEPLP